jgi:MOSC domain-containing protein YiiM
VENYEYWRNELPGTKLPCGMFGENSTIEGLLEKEVNIGDRFRAGEVQVVIAEPRLPFSKQARSQVRTGRRTIFRKAKKESVL